MDPDLCAPCSSSEEPQAVSAPGARSPRKWPQASRCCAASAASPTLRRLPTCTSRPSPPEARRTQGQQLQRQGAPCTRQERPPQVLLVRGAGAQTAGSRPCSPQGHRRASATGRRPSIELLDCLSARSWGPLGASQDGSARAPRAPRQKPGGASCAPLPVNHSSTLPHYLDQETAKSVGLQIPFCGAFPQRRRTCPAVHKYRPRRSLCHQVPYLVHATRAWRIGGARHTRPASPAAPAKPPPSRPRQSLSP
mmetsp:Transcript_92710/g.161100  ORF Transcript_92710/g.161100 Transcript_92710/m.161100 type:complete len:251 (+) Transcript_92710:1135-1887(+)